MNCNFSVVQVLLLKKQNEDLHAEIDTVETEMVSLHAAIEERDRKIHTFKRECDRLRRNIKQLHVRVHLDLLAFAQSVEISILV